jgi:hypothetical protein
MMPVRTKKLAQKWLATFKLQAKRRDRKPNKRRLKKLLLRRQFKKYTPKLVEVLVNVYHPRHNTVHINQNTNRRTINTIETGIAPMNTSYFASDSDTSLILPEWFITHYKKELRVVIPGGNRQFLVDPHEFVQEALAVASKHSAGALASIEAQTDSSSADILLELVVIQDLPVQLATDRAVRDRPLRDGERRMTHPWLAYPATLRGKNFEEMFQNDKYYYDGGCMTAAIMNTYADAWNTREDRPKDVLVGQKRKGRPPTTPPDITPRSIHDIVWPPEMNIPFSPHTIRPMSFTEAKRWFKKYNVKATLWNSRFEFVDESVQERTGKNQEPKKLSKNGR